MEVRVAVARGLIRSAPSARRADTARVHGHPRVEAVSGSLGIDFAAPATVITQDPPIEHTPVAIGQRAVPANQQVKLLPAQAVEVAVAIMGADDNAAAQ